MCGYRKYPYPHHGRNWKFQRGGGGLKAQEIPEGWGVDGQINFQVVHFDSLLTYSTAVVVRKLLLADFGGTF